MDDPDVYRQENDRSISKNALIYFETNKPARYLEIMADYNDNEENVKKTG